MRRREAVKLSATALGALSLGFIGGKLASLSPVSEGSTIDTTTQTTSTPAKSSEKISLAYSGNKQFYHYPLELSKQHLLRLGYDFDVLFLDAARGREAFASKRSQIATVSPPVLISLAEAGEHVIFGPITAVVYYVIASKKNIEELTSSQSVRVGIALLGSPGHYFASLLLEEKSVKNVSWYEVGSSRDRLAALMNNSIDIAALIYTEALTAQQQGIEIEFIGEPQPFWIATGFYRDWVEQNQEFVIDFMKSLFVAKAYCGEDKDRFIREALEYAQVEQSPEMLDIAGRIYDLYTRDGFWTRMFAPSVFYEDLMHWAIKEKIIEGKVDIHPLIDDIKVYYDEVIRKLSDL